MLLFIFQTVQKFREVARDALRLCEGLLQGLIFVDGLIDRRANHKEE